MSIAKKFTKLLVLTIALSLSTVLLVGMLRGKKQKEQQMLPVNETSEAEMKLTDMEYTEMQKGRRIWTLKAAEAKYFQEDQKTALTNVKLVFFLESGEEIHLESRHGMLYAGSKDIELWSAVHAQFPRGYELSTEKAYYNHEDSLISSKAAILITGPDLKLISNHWKYLIPERRALLEGKVQATLALEPNDKITQ
jgi:LPS export ABC transporter protein LptC